MKWKAHVFLAAMLLLTAVATAAEMGTEGTQAICNVTHLIEVFAAAIALIMLLYSGACVMMARNDPAKKAEAQGQMYGVITGIMVILLAGYIVTSLFPASWLELLKC